MSETRWTILNKVDTSGWSPARLAYAFYGTAAGGAVIGQVWVALKHITFPDDMPTALAVLIVLPFAACIELLAMALAAMGDERQRLGERAIGWRAFSAVVAVLAVGIIVLGHWGHLYIVAGFSTLSASAYLLWLLHSAARRRDALRAAGMLEQVAPAFGVWMWLRHPVLTSRARQLASRQGLDLAGSLSAAQAELVDEQQRRHAGRRRRRIAKAVRAVVRAEHTDRRDAKAAELTLDLDRIAVELQASADYDWWRGKLADRLGIAPPAAPEPELVAEPEPEPHAGYGQTMAEVAEILNGAALPGGLMDRVAAAQPLAGLGDDGKGRHSATTPGGAQGKPPEPERKPAEPKRERAPRPARKADGKTTAAKVAQLLRRRPDMDSTEVAAKLGVSERTVQRARKKLNGHASAVSGG